MIKKVVHLKKMPKAFMKLKVVKAREYSIEQEA